MVPNWHRTGDGVFPLAARVDGSWWVLRMNSFPEHPLYTLFVDGAGIGDHDDAPLEWGAVTKPVLPLLDPADATAALAPLADLTAFGSERGEPCDCDYCV